MNVERLRRIQSAILAHPERFDMASWVCLPPSVRPDDPNRYALEAQDWCGTTCCLGGWGLVLFGGSDRNYSLDNALNDKGSWWWAAMCSAVDLSDDQGRALFMEGNWPAAFCRQYRDAVDDNDPERAAQVAAARINHFIEHSGQYDE